MYDFHYNHIKKKYGDRAALCFTDTDSLCYKISIEDMREDPNYSDYSEGHFLHSNFNKKVLGKMKVKCQGHIVQEFIGLKPKIYSFVHEKKTF